MNIPNCRIKFDLQYELRKESQFGSAQLLFIADICNFIKEENEITSGF
jgi:hypothetical protein